MTSPIFSNLKLADRQVAMAGACLLNALEYFKRANDLESLIKVRDFEEQIGAFHRHTFKEKR